MTNNIGSSHLFSSLIKNELYERYTHRTTHITIRLIPNLYTTMPLKHEKSHIQTDIKDNSRLYKVAVHQTF